MSLKAGDKLGPYEIISLIGKGGMGEVYGAHDPRTGRDVAIKISAERFSERFDREVRAVAALSHPNICTLYDVGPNYLVMELVEGESPQGPLPLEEALRIARQIAAALEEAHEKGIVHRDLKPGNIKVKPDGTVKVLDFGLAKIGLGTSAGAPASALEDSADHQHGRDASGRHPAGTAAYMAPKQTRGKTGRHSAPIFGPSRSCSRDVDWEAAVSRGRPHRDARFRGQGKARPGEHPAWRCVRCSSAAWRRTPSGGCATSATRWRWSTPGSRRRRDPRSLALQLPSRSPFVFASVAAGLLAIGLGTLAFVHFREQPPASARTDPLPDPDARAGYGQQRFYMTMSPDGRKVAYTLDQRRDRTVSTGCGFAPWIRWNRESSPAPKAR